MGVGRLIRKGLPLSNVVTAGTATNIITPGRTLENLQLRIAATGAGASFTKANISMFKMKANGKVIVEGTGTEIDKINAYRGAGQTDAAFLDIYFSDYSLNNEYDRQVGAFDTSVGIANITTEVTTSGIVGSPTIDPILFEIPQQKLKTGEMAPFAPMISKVLRYPFSQAVGGKLPVTVPFGPQNGAIIKRLHVMHGGNMTAATVKQDGIVVHESVKAENEFDQKRKGRVPQANTYTIDFVVDGDVNKALNTRDARQLEWLFEFSAADNGTIVVEYLDLLQNL